MKELAKVFTAFFKIGLFTFGGGYAMLPMIQKEIVEKHGWATDEEVMDYFAVGQCTPGIIAVNTATFIGYYRKGIVGSATATLGVVSPSLIIITVIAAFIQNYSDIPAVQCAFTGITAAVAVLIINAVVKLWKSGIKDITAGILFAAVLAARVIFNIPSAMVVVVVVIIGIIAQLRRDMKNKRVKK